MLSRQNLIDKILTDSFLPRAEQVECFNEYQNEIRDSNYNRIVVEMPENLHIFFSYYEYEDYSGFGYLWGYDSDLDTFFYNSGSHCSCYGLEGQWDIEYNTYEEMIVFVKSQIETSDQTSYWFKQDQYDAHLKFMKILYGE